MFLKGNRKLYLTSSVLKIMLIHVKRIFSLNSGVLTVSLKWFTVL